MAVSDSTDDMRAAQSGQTQPASQTSAAAESQRQQRLRLAVAQESRRDSEAAALPSAHQARFVASRTSVAWVAAVCVALATAAGGLLLYGRSGADHVSDSDKAAWAAAWAAAEPTRLHIVPPSEIPEALAAMALPAEQERQLEDDLAGGVTRLVWLSFTDVVAQDGDRVRVESGPYATEVTALHESTRVYLPEPPTGVVNVTGIHDGGGGITIAITSGEVPVNLPFMNVGQAVGIPTVAMP